MTSEEFLFLDQHHCDGNVIKVWALDERSYRLAQKAIARAVRKRKSENQEKLDPKKEEAKNAVCNNARNIPAFTRTFTLHTFTLRMFDHHIHTAHSK